MLWRWRCGWPMSFDQADFQPIEGHWSARDIRTVTTCAEQAIAETNEMLAGRAAEFGLMRFLYADFAAAVQGFHGLAHQDTAAWSIYVWYCLNNGRYYGM